MHRGFADGKDLCRPADGAAGLCYILAQQAGSIFHTPLPMAYMEVYGPAAKSMPAPAAAPNIRKTNFFAFSY